MTMKNIKKKKKNKQTNLIYSLKYWHIFLSDWFRFIQLSAYFVHIDQQPSTVFFNLSSFSDKTHEYFILNMVKVWSLTDKFETSDSDYIFRKIS